MAAGRIKGITIEIGANTTQLTKALAQVDYAIKNTQSNLRDIERALKMNPGNTELIKDKQVELANAIKETEERLKTEQEALNQMRNSEGFDENSQAARNLKVQIDLDTVALEELKKKAKETSSVLGEQMKAAGERMKEVGEKIKSVGDALSNVGGKLTTAFTVPIVAAGTKAVSSFAEVDKTMTLANKTMNNTTEEADLLNKAMESAASNSTFGMNDAANAALNFARAGLDAAQAADAMAPAMNLAAGEAGDLDVVSGGLVGTINGFGDEFSEAEHYADVFAAACNNSALDVNGLADSMSVAAPIFATAGKDVEDAALYLGIMANAEIDANVAANSLKTGIARLAEPTKQAKKAMEEYGIAMSDIWNEDGSMKDSVTIQQNLHDSFARLSEQEQMAAAGAIFGKNQMASWLALINTAPAEVDALSESIRGSAGTTQEMADAMMSGFGGSIEKLKSSLDVLMTSLGSIIAEYLTPLIEKIQGAVDAFMAMDDETKKHIVQIAAIIAAIGPVLLIVGKVITAISTITSVVGAITTAIGAIIPVITTIGGVITGTVIPAIAAIGAPVLAVVAAIGAVIAVIVLCVKHWDEIKAKTQEVVQAMSQKWDEFKNKFSQTWDNIKSNLANKVQAMTQKWNEFKNNFSQAWNTMKSNMSNNVENMRQKWDGFKSNVSAIWNNLRSSISTAAGNISSNVSSRFSELKNNASGRITELKTSAVSVFSSMSSSISNTVGNIRSAVVNGFQNAISYIRSLPSQAIGWGRDIINGIVDGIWGAIGRVRDAMSDLADTIASYIHFSEPDVGPLKNFHTYMPDMMNELVKGIENNLPKLESAMGTLAGSMIPSAGAANGSTTTTNTNTVSINVYGAQGQDVSELADIIEQRISDNVVRRGVAFS